MLAEHFPRHGEFEPLAYRFNRIMVNRYYEILDFINLHYCLTRREDTAFWREIRRPERINDRLRAKLDFWRIKPPTALDFEDQFFPGQPASVGKGGSGDARVPVDTGRLWNHHSYENVAYGMDFLLEESRQWFGEQRPRPGILKRVHNSRCVAARTGHGEFQGLTSPSRQCALAAGYWRAVASGFLWQRAPRASGCRN